MLKKKSIKLVILGSLMPILLIGCSFSKSESNVNNQGDNTSELLNQENIIEDGIQSTLDVKTTYDELFSKYKDFAQYIYQVDENGQPVKANDEAIQPEGKLALGEFMEILKTESEQKSELIENDIFQTYTTNFDELTQQVSQFKEKINNSSIIDDQKKQDILTKFEDKNNQDLWLISPISKKFMGYFSNNKLEKQEICNIQRNLGTKINGEIANENNCGNFDPSTYAQLENVLRNKTLEFGNKLTEIKPLIPEFTPKVETVSSPKIPLWLLIISPLGFLTAIVGIVTTYVMFLRLNERNKKLHSVVVSHHKKIKNLEAEVEELSNNIIKILSQKPHFPSSSGNANPSTIITESPESESNFATPADIKTAKFDQDNSDTNDTNDSISLIRQGTQVRMTQETTNNVMDGTWNGVVNLEKFRNGEYLIVSNNSEDEYVFLDPMTKFNPQTLQLINKSKLFICHGNLLNTVKGEEIKVHKPAKVRRNGQYWTLVESGELILS